MTKIETLNISDVFDEINQKYSGVLLQAKQKLYVETGSGDGDAIDKEEMVMFLDVKRDDGFAWRVISKGKIVTFWSNRNLGLWFYV